MVQVKKGNAWTAVVIGPEFTVDLFKRLSGENSSIISGSTIYLYMDVTSEFTVHLNIKLCVVFWLMCVFWVYRYSNYCHY